MKQVVRALTLLTLLVCLCAAAPSAHAAAEGTCGTSTSWTLDEDGLLTISGTGKVTTYKNWESYKDSITAVVVEEGVTSLCSSVFRNCRNLVSVELAETVEYVGMYGFQNCTALRQLDLPDYCLLEMYCFSNCDSLVEVTIPRANGVPSDLFSYCDRLERVTLSDNLWFVAPFAFAYCPQLTELILPESVTQLSMQAFNCCDNLSRIQVLGTLDELTGGYSNCTLYALEGIWFYGDAPGSISDGCFKACASDFTLYYTQGTKGWDQVTQAPTAVFDPEQLPPMPVSAALTFAAQLEDILDKVGGTEQYSTWLDSIVHALEQESPERIAQLQAKAREITAGCTTDEERIRAVSDFVSGWVYYDTQNANGTYVPEFETYFALETLENRYGVCENYSNLACALLRALDIPSVVISGFSGSTCHAWNASWDGTRWIYFDPTFNSNNHYDHEQQTFEQGKVVSYWWDMSPYMALLHEDHRADTIEGLEWSDLRWVLSINPRTYGLEGASIQGACGDTLTELTIPAQFYGAPVTSIWPQDNQRVQKLKVEMKSINFSAFENWTALERVEIAEGVERIGDEAFKGCTALTQVTISDTVTTIGASVFANCTALKNLDVPDSVIQCGTYLVSGCTALEWLDIGGGFTTINASEFAKCPSLQWVRFPESLTSVNTYGFYQSSVPTLIFSGAVPVWSGTNTPVRSYGSASTIYYPQEESSWQQLASGGYQMKPYQEGLNVGVPDWIWLEGCFAPEQFPDQAAQLVVATYDQEGRMTAWDVFDYRPGDVPVYELFFCGDFGTRPYAKAFWLDAVDSAPLLPFVRSEG